MPLYSTHWWVLSTTFDWDPLAINDSWLWGCCLAWKSADGTKVNVWQAFFSFNTWFAIEYLTRFGCIKYYVINTGDGQEIDQHQALVVRKCTMQPDMDYQRVITSYPVHWFMPTNVTSFITHVKCAVERMENVTEK